MWKFLKGCWARLTPSVKPRPDLPDDHPFNREEGTCVVCRRLIYREQAISFSHSGTRCGKHFDS
jgi:hypothetical protein